MRPTTRPSSRLATVLAIAQLCAALAVSGAAGQATATLVERIDSIVDAPPFGRAHWGIVVEDLASGERLYERNADRLFIPASSLKLVVATAAARLLGPGFRYTTELLATGPIEGGTLRGDIVIRGTGDPTLSGRYADSLTAVWASLADSLRARGIERIEGRVIADASAWDDQHVLGEWEAYDLLWWYAAPVGPLGFNDNAIDFRIRPGPLGEPALIEAEPRSDFFVLRNETVTIPAGGTRTLDFDRVPGTDTILAYGEIPADAPARTEHFAVVEPARYAATVMRETFERGGIDVAIDEVLVVRSPDSAVVTARPVVAWRSPPLDSIIAPVLRTSQNWFAEQLVKTLGHSMAGDGSWSAGLDVERRFLIDSIGIDSTAFRLRDASGLSTGNLITPAVLARLLRHVRDRDIAPVIQALPTGGADPGSLRTRLVELGPRVRAKTGSMRNVASLSGFVTTEDGRELIFVIIANATAQPTSATARVIDAVVRALAGL